MVFTYPWVLLGLLGVLIPMAIHLFELRRPQRMLFSNVEFIREVQLVTARQRKLKHLLVLASRIAFVVFLVLLFAQPVLRSSQQKQEQKGAVGVAMDTSPSMQQEGITGSTILEQGMQEAAGLPLAFPTGARFVLAPRTREVLNAGAFRAAVEQLQFSGQANGGPVRQLSRLQQTTDGPLFIFSDFQRNSFSGRSLEDIDSARQVYLVPLASENSPNVFVDSVWLDDAFVRAGEDLTLQVRLRNGGGQVAQDRQVKVFVGRQQAAVFRASVLPQQTQTTQVRVRLNDAGGQACRVEVDDAPVDFDNTFYFTLQPAASIPIVEIAASAQLNRLYGNEPLFVYQHTAAQSPDVQKLSGASLLILREAVSIGAGLREQVRRAVQAGATLVVVPAATSNQASYAQLFRELGVGPVQWQLPVQGTVPTGQEVAMPSAQHPFFRDVFAGINQRAAMPKVVPVLRWSRSGMDVLRLRDGEGYLAGFPSGAGTVYVFAAPLSAPYADFAQHPLFVPVMYRLALQSYQQEQRPAYRLTEQTISLRLPKAATAASAQEQVFQLVQDSAVYIPAQRVQNGTVRLELPPTLQRPGFYAVQRAGRTITTVALNLDKRESDLRRYSAAELRQLVGANRPNIHVYELEQGQTVAARYRATQAGVPLWRYCLWVALACLLLEGALLRWPRRKAEAVPQPVAA